MLFRSPSTNRVEIWWVICSDSSLSSPLLITPFDISSQPHFFFLSLSISLFLPLSDFVSSHLCNFPLSSASTTCLTLLLSLSSLIPSSAPPCPLYRHTAFLSSFIPPSPAPVIFFPHLLPSSSHLVLLFNISMLPCFLMPPSLYPQVQYSAYVGVGGLFSVVKLLCGGLLFWFMVKFSLGRKLLTTVATHIITQPLRAILVFVIWNPSMGSWSETATQLQYVLYVC